MLTIISKLTKESKLDIIYKHAYYCAMKKSTAIHLFGSIPELARLLGITPHAIYQWGEEVPPLRAFQIKELAGQKGIPIPHSPHPEQEHAA